MNLGCDAVINSMNGGQRTEVQKSDYTTSYASRNVVTLFALIIRYQHRDSHDHERLI